MPLKPRKPVVAVVHEPAPSITLVTPPAGLLALPEECSNGDDVSVDVSFESISQPSTSFSSTEPMLPRVAPYPSYESFESFEPAASYARYESCEDYGFAPRYSEPVLPRMVTIADIEDERPSFGHRAARALTRLAVTSAALVAIVTAVAFGVSWKLDVPVTTVHAIAAREVNARLDVGAVEHEPIVVTPLEVQPHAPVTVQQPRAARPGTVARARR
ncbi:MAG: hypothetical protein KIT84_14700 [Labilithrix sp.]|nr:hypothetical protein [Labilithrix sp.]MCW5812271.1 hypothetical protein [Labilithrix sp.]